MTEQTEEGTVVETRLSEQELGKLYKRQLENWRELLCHLNDLFIWDKPYYPGIIAACITFIFLLLWYFEPSILTTFSVIGIIACILDYAVPMLSSNVFDSNKWTGVQERKFQDICQNLAHTRYLMQNAWCTLNSFKEKNPKLYFIGIVGSLILMAWIGNLVDNLFLSYLFTLTAALYPGLKHHNILDKYIAQTYQMFKEKKNN